MSNTFIDLQLFAKSRLCQAFLVLVSLSVTATGCGKKSHMPVFPVVGQVSHKGKPAEGAVVVFQGVDKKLMGQQAPLPRAKCDKEGKFSLTSFKRDDGAPAGNYNVAIVWPSRVKTDVNIDPEEAERLSRDRLNGKYSDPENPAFEVEVVAGDNVLEPFNVE